jgi:hypothetical protein
MPTTLVAMTDKKSETTEDVTSSHEGGQDPGFHVISAEQLFAGLRESARRITQNQPERPMRTWEIGSPTLDSAIRIKAHTMLMADDGRVVFLRIDEFGHDYVTDAFRFAEFGVQLIED